MLTFDTLRKTLLAIMILVTLVYAVNNYGQRPSSKSGRLAKQNKLVKVLTTDQVSAVATKEARVNLEEAEKMLKKKGIEKLTDPFALRISVRSTGGQKGGAEVLPEDASTGLKLEGIWFDSGVRMAFISGQTVTEGQSVLGWQVKRIEGNQVLLVKGEKSRILRLEE